MNTSRRLILGLALLAASVTAPASAYPNGLLLGQKGTSLSGMVTLSSSGTLISGTYQYYDANNIPSPVNPSQNSFDALFAYGSSSVTVTGGSFYSLYAYDNVTATISGGTINGLSAQGFSTINITGLPQQTSGAGFSLGASGSGTIDLFGTGFTATPTVDADVFTIRGTLLDGQSLIANYFGNGGRLLFNGVAAPVPEASTNVSLGLLIGLGLSGVVVARRRRSRPG